MRRAAVLVLGVSLACCGSGKPSVDISPVELALSSAAALGMTSSLAMSAMSSTASVPCAKVTQACTSYPCSNGAVTITLGAECPFPIGGAGSGTVTVTANWTSATSATLSSTFTNVQVGGASSVVVSATSITATPTTFTYTGQNVNVHGVGVLAAQSSWTVTANGTGGLTLSGTDQSVAGALDTTQITLSDVTLDPSCTQNPTSGSATLQSVNGFKIQNDTLSFHSACDGKVDVDGTAVALDFTNSNS